MMFYNIYKNCDERCFTELKDALNQIRSLVLAASNRFSAKARYDDADLLFLNFEIADDSECNGTLGIVFEDLPKAKTFRVAFTKSIDLEGLRYGVVKDLLTGASIEKIKCEIESISRELLAQYDLITKAELLQQQGTEISRFT